MVFMNYFWSVNFNSYLLHIQERHLWKKNPKVIFWSLMTSYIADDTLLMTSHKSETTPVRLPIRHMTWITWRHQCEISRDEKITPEKPGTELASFLEKIQTRLGTSGSVISGKIIHLASFQLFWWIFWKKRILGNE